MHRLCCPVSTAPHHAYHLVAPSLCPLLPTSWKQTTQQSCGEQEPDLNRTRRVNLRTGHSPATPPRPPNYDNTRETRTPNSRLSSRQPQPTAQSSTEAQTISTTNPQTRTSAAARASSVSNTRLDSCWFISCSASDIFSCDRDRLGDTLRRLLVRLMWLTWLEWLPVGLPGSLLLLLAGDALAAPKLPRVPTLSLVPKVQPDRPVRPEIAEMPERPRLKERAGWNSDAFDAVRLMCGRWGLKRGLAGVAGGRSGFDGPPVSCVRAVTYGTMLRDGSDWMGAVFHSS